MVFVRKTRHELLAIISDKKGKIISLTTPVGDALLENFSVSLSWEALQELRDRFEQDVFDWKAEDASFAVYRKSDTIHLRFPSFLIPGLFADISLYGNEADLLKNGLLKSPEEVLSDGYCTAPLSLIL